MFCGSLGVSLLSQNPIIFHNIPRPSLSFVSIVKDLILKGSTPQRRGRINRLQMYTACKYITGLLLVGFVEVIQVGG